MIFLFMINVKKESGKLIRWGRKRGGGGKGNDDGIKITNEKYKSSSTIFQ
jgi:hypothetical protein